MLIEEPHDDTGPELAQISAGLRSLLANRKLEVEAIAKSGLHRVQYPHRQNGLAGLGLAMATVCAALPSVLRELADADGQRLVTLKSIDPGRDHRYGVRDPAIDPPKCHNWPPEQAYPNLSSVLAWGRVADIPLYFYQGDGAPRRRARRTRAGRAALRGGPGAARRAMKLRRGRRRSRT